MPWNSEDWERLGGLLVARRVDLRSAWSNRRQFADDTMLDYRVVYDIEKHRRQNFSPATCRRLEKAYGLRHGAIKAVLDGAVLDGWVDEGPPIDGIDKIDQLDTRIVKDGEFEVFLASAAAAITQLSPEQREEAERTTIRLLRGMLRDMGADI
ncbi:hypothetical protein SAMN05421505_1492 [Sinosporangium album]|uniref:Helix-turn-helix domain-containing protein n=1 Tax=Sinosporangium album TaxID=504805 RepID=A0A1G8KA60_9ACTN|nr:hypothetical protein SAMN05421505_1492 [Sinosporangium album]